MAVMTYFFRLLNSILSHCFYCVFALTFVRLCTAAMLDGRNKRFFFPWEHMFFLMQIIFIVLPSNMAAVQNL